MPLLYLLLGPSLALIAHPLSHYPLVWFPYFSGLVSTFGLEKEKSMVLIFWQRYLGRDLQAYPMG
jgi:hypothetical protein